MPEVGLWEIGETGPTRLQVGDVGLERDLEDWIEAQPDLLMVGLTVIGRQVQTDAGRIDLLGLDAQGRLVVIEMKRGTVRRDTIAQVLDYASCMAKLDGEALAEICKTYLSRTGRDVEATLEHLGGPGILNKEERELSLFVVGTGRDPGLERMTNYLCDEHNLPITVVAFQIFQVPGGNRLLARELTEPIVAERPKQIDRTNVEDICKLADAEGIGEPYRAILRAAEAVGLYPRPYKRSIMYTPPKNRTRMLFTAWAKEKGGGVTFYSDSKAFSEFFPVSAQDVRDLIGPDGWRTLSTEAVGGFVAGLERTFELVKRAEADSEMSSE